MSSNPTTYFCHPLSEAAKQFRHVDMKRMEQFPFFAVPVFLSPRVWNRCIRVPKWASPGVSEKGHLWDLLHYLMVCVADSGFTGPESPFNYRIRNLEPDGPEERVRLKAVLYVDHAARRRLTVLFADEESWQSEQRIVWGERLVPFVLQPGGRR